MRYQKKGPKRLTALLLAGVLTLGLVPLPTSAAGDDSFVSSNNLNDIFEWNDPSGFGAGIGISGNSIHFCNTSASVLKDGYRTGSAGARSKRWVSLEADWEVGGTFDVTIDTNTPHVYTRGFVVIKARDTKQILFSAGKYENHIGLRLMTGTAVKPNTGAVGVKDLDLSYFKGSKNFRITYTAATDILSCTYGDYTLTYKMSDFFGSAKEVTVTLAGTICWQDGKTAPASDVQGTFSTAAYTKYYPQFVKTEVLQTNGTPFPTNSPPVNSQIVMVKSTVKNANAGAGGQAVPCTLKLLQGDSTYPTAGIVPLTAAEGQQIVANGAAVPANTDIINSGIPFKMTGAGDNTITYLARIANPSGAAVTVGQTIADDFFQSHRYSKAELIPAIPLVAGDPDPEPDPDQPQPVPGTDYHYTRTPANQNGWNTGAVEIAFSPGTFNQFNIRDGVGNLVVGLHSGNPQQHYNGETGGIPLSYQAVNTANGKLSSTVSDTVKIDATAPTLRASGTALTAADGLSGVWKLERQDPVTGTWSAAKTFSLSSSGNGSASQTFTPTQNGIYRAVDAAGNPSAATLSVTVNDPPEIAVKDEPNHHSPQAPTVSTDEAGLTHAVYTDSIEEIISDPPAYGGALTGSDLKSIIEGRYQFTSHSGTLSGQLVSMTQNGADISATGLDSSAPGSCQAVYRITDQDGNTATLELTYTFKERVEPPAIDPADPNTPVPEPEEEVDKGGLVHQTYREQIVQIITDPPAFGGTLTADDLKAVIEGRYSFGAGTVAYAMTQNGADISAAGLPSTVPGSCLGRYTVTDGDGNSTTLELTYTFIEKPVPPAILPDDPEHPPQGPEETIDPDNTVHRRYTDAVVELISDPPAYGGSFTLGDALGYIRDHYDFAAGSASLVGHSLTMEQGGRPVVEISSAAPGSCLITYTVTDRDGNSTTLELTYTFKERVEPPAVLPVDPEQLPQGPEEEVDRDGLIHHIYRDKIVVPITDPPQFGGLLTADKLRETIEGQYHFGAGSVAFAMMQNGADISATGLPSTVPGSCLGVYTVTDSQGNSTTLELTYEYVERYDPPVIEPADPERPLPEPEETVDPDATVHRSYRDGITELVAYPPAFGGTLSAEKALDWMQGQYQIAPGTGAHLKESVALYQSGQDITDQGFATDRPGSCLILYRVVDEYGNSASLAFAYALTERQVEGSDIVSDGADSGQNSAGSGPYTGELSGHAHRQPADCWVHWLALVLMAIALAYLLTRKRQLDREEEKARENL